MKKILVLILSTLITYSISSTQVTIHSPLSLTQKINEEYPAYNLCKLINLNSFTTNQQFQML